MRREACFLSMASQLSLCSHVSVFHAPRLVDVQCCAFFPLICLLQRCQAEDGLGDAVELPLPQITSRRNSSSWVAMSAIQNVGHAKHIRNKMQNECQEADGVDFELPQGRGKTLPRQCECVHAFMWKEAAAWMRCITGCPSVQHPNAGYIATCHQGTSGHPCPLVQGLAELMSALQQCLRGYSPHTPSQGDKRP